jgi:hypothetical protein
MPMTMPYRRCLVAACAAAVLITGLAPLQASLVSTEQLVHTQQRQADRDRLLGLLAREDVRQQLTAQGVDPDFAAMRAERLGSEELLLLSAHLDELPAGASAGTVVGVVVLFTLVFIITDAIGATDIFPFIKPVR